MRKQRSEYVVIPEEELDLQHQGSLGGQQPIGKYGRVASESNISSPAQSGSAALTPGRKRSEGPEVAMTSPSHKGGKPEHPERTPSEGPAQAQSSKKHHYK